MGIFDRWKKKKEKEEARTDIEEMEKKKDDYKGSVEAFKRCPTCGAELPAGAIECPECGEKLEYSVEDSKIVDKLDIDKMEKEKNYKGLVRALSCPDPGVRWDAAWALGRIAEKGEARAVVEAGAVPKLVECLDDAVPYVRLYAVEALSRIFSGFTESVENELARFRSMGINTDEEERLVRELKESTERKDWEKNPELVNEIIGLLSRYQTELERRITLLRERASEFEKFEQCPTCGAELPAGAIECPECGEKLEYSVEDSKIVDKPYRPYINKMEKEKDYKGLVQKLSYPDPEVRGNAALTLGRITAEGDARAVVEAGAMPKLVECLDDENKDVRENAARVLGGIAKGGKARAVVSAGAVLKLVKCLDDADEDVRKYAVWALGRIAAGGEARAVVSAGAVPKLVERLDDEN